MEPPTIKKAEDRPEKATKTNSAIWSSEVSTYVKRRAGMEEGIEKVFPLILGQCTNSTSEKLKGFDTYDSISSSFDTIGLLKLIKSMVYKFRSQRHPALSIHQAKRKLYMIKQERHVTNSTYLEQFTNNTGVIEHIGGIICSAGVSWTREQASPWQARQQTRWKPPRALLSSSTS
jgi:hypothetical protein